MLLDSRTVAQAMGGDVYRKNQVRCPGPGHSANDRSLSIFLIPEASGGFRVHSFAGDDPIQCRDYVRQTLGLPAFATGTPQPRFYRKPKTKHKPAGNNSAPALRIWEEGRAVPGTPGASYLYNRVPNLPAAIFDAGALRYHPACTYKHRATGEIFRLPTLLALLRDVVTNEPRAIHRTAIFPDGSGKAVMPDGDTPKRMLGSAAGCVIKLSPNEEVETGLSLAEGLETSLSVYARGIRPIWCTGTAGGIKKFPVVDGIEALVIYADHDENQTGQRAALACAERWSKAGRECRIIYPKKPGTDWNDVLVGEWCHA